MKEFIVAFLALANSYCPHMPLEEKALMPIAIWQGSGHDLKNAATLSWMAVLESQLRVRKYFPYAKQNMDLLGTHNDVLCLELWREGYITDSKEWKKSKQWPMWRKLFQQRPDIGTYFACKAFVRLADRFGLDNSVQMWKEGKTGTIPGLLYLMKVRCGRKDMMKMCHR